ncbi:hypothetical protein [Paraburkholderia terrae]|uniref:Uncharacterized protein n=1 Tax=Paraburkholderia terrae TaxID=311230 RepID=A0A2I8EKX3_9BURK|nr:hypothetical protein [Paraburkholderia terrae]AUT60243.1 hypothetical protein C2L65_11980 [Paraburkholderia terrae]
MNLKLKLSRGCQNYPERRILGLKDCLVHDKDKPLVEFYYARCMGKEGFDPGGQFISRHYVGTMFERL